MEPLKEGRRSVSSLEEAVGRESKKFLLLLMQMAIVVTSFIPEDFHEHVRFPPSSTDQSDGSVPPLLFPPRRIDDRESGPSPFFLFSPCLLAAPY